MTISLRWHAPLATWNSAIRTSSTPIIRRRIRACSPISASRPSRSSSWGRRSPQEVLAEQCAPALFPRTTNRYGCVTWHSYHFSREEGIPKSQVLLWVYGEPLRAVLDHVVLAAYRCRYDGQARKVTDIHAGTLYTTRFTSPQEALIPLNPQEFLAVYRPQASRRRALQRVPRKQLVLFELVSTG